MLRNVIQSIESMEAPEISQTLAEKRRSLRVRSYAKVELELEGELHKAVVTEIGVDGLRLKIMDIPLDQAQELVISAQISEEELESGPVRAAVAWTQKNGRDTIAGCRFVDSRENMRRSWVRFLLQEIGFDESRIYQRRKHLRVDSAIPARLIENQVGVCDGKVVNLGIGGALVETAEALTKGSSLELEMSLWRILPTLRLPARVLDSRPDALSGQHLSSLQFANLESPQIKTLGNYIINMINMANP
jgi:hypothetical protein